MNKDQIIAAINSLVPILGSQSISGKELIDLAEQKLIELIKDL